MKEKTDRLYELLPVVYRQRDIELGQPLRALLTVISEQVNIVEEDIRQLYDNWFIETCEDWVVPYIADLIGHRIVHEAGEPGAVTTAQGQLRNKFLVPRREVANTIGNRRRKGTLSLLELLGRDVAGWPPRAVEFYQLLGWTQHINHLHPERARTVDLRAGDALDRINTAFDELSHTVDVRRTGSHRTRGRYNIPEVGLFVWRLNAYSSTLSPAFCTDRARNHFTFSVLGTNTQLYTSPTAEPAPTHIADEMNVPAPIRRRALEERTLDYYGPGKSLCIFTGQDDGKLRAVPAANIVAADLSHWAYVPRREQVAVDPRLGRIIFSSEYDPRTGVWVTYHYGFSADMGGGEYERRLRPACLPRSGWNEEPVPASDEPKPEQPEKPKCQIYRVSQSPEVEGQPFRVQAESPEPKTQTPEANRKFERIGDALRAWKAESAIHPEAVIEIEDSGAYVEPLEFKLERGQRLEIRAVNGARPAIKLLNYYTNRPEAVSIIGPTEKDEKAEKHRAPRHRQERTAPPTGAAALPELPPLPSLIFDGLLITGRSVQITGALTEVVIRHSTLVPGWSLDNHCRPENEAEPSIELVDTSARLRIEHSIVGTIRVTANEVTTDPTSIQISDSILDSVNHDLEALSGPGRLVAHAVLRLLRSTVFGKVRVHAIELAENSILMGRVLVARSQLGCVRFCYVRPRSRTPRRYNCQPDLVLAQLPPAKKGEADALAEARADEEARVRPRFNSTVYATPRYCQLSEDCAPEIRRGADDESEMGAFHDLFQPQREANLRARLNEFTPAGMDAGLIFAD